MVSFFVLNARFQAGRIDVQSENKKRSDASEREGARELGRSVRTSRDYFASRSASATTT